MTPPARYKDLCLDARDRVAVGRFWAAVLGLEFTDRGDGVAVLTGPTPRHTVWVNDVPEPKAVKNRVHLDVHTGSVAELEALGARLVDDTQRWTVMADPEGGEFCAFVREQVPANRLYELVLDAADAPAVARWWAELLGGRYDEEDGEVAVGDVPDAPFEWLPVITVPEPKRGKNRVHVDLYADDVAQLLARGATLLRPPGEGHDWHVLADPEGNEFCVFRP